MAGAALATKLWLRPRSHEWAEDLPALHHPEHSRFIEVDGLRVHYQEAGPTNGETLLLVHGFCASTFVWSDVLLPLAQQGFRIIAVDLPGFGFSEKPKDGEYTIEWQARCLSRFLDELKIEAATLVGSSYGGAVSTVFALDYPHRLKRLVIVGGITDDEIKDEWLMRLGASKLLGDLVSPLLLSSRRLHQWRMKDVYANGDKKLLSDERLAAHRLPLLAADTHHAVLTTLRRWSAGRVSREAHLVKQPTLLLWGDDDRAVPLRHGLHLLAEMPTARLFVFRRCGHLPQEEYPQLFTALVSEFCHASHSEASGTVEVYATQS